MKKLISSPAILALFAAIFLFGYQAQGSVSFNRGSDDFVQTGISVGTSSFTFECWVYMVNASSTGNYSILEAQGPSNAEDKTLRLIAGSGATFADLYADVQTGGVVNQATTPTSTQYLNQWIYARARFNAPAKTIDVYGWNSSLQLIGSSSTATTASSTTNNFGVNIAGSYPFNTPNTGPNHNVFNGYMRNCYISHDVATDQQTLDRAQATNPTLTAPGNAFLFFPLMDASDAVRELVNHTIIAPTSTIFTGPNPPLLQQSY